MGIAIVTGGASGIGLALGRALVRRAGHVVLVDIDAERAAEAADILTRQGAGTAEPAVLDVADAAAVSELINSTHRRHGRLNLLFNHAGIGVGGEPEELTLAHWDRAIDVNLRGVINGCHAAYPLMKQQGFGRIVNTASLAGLGPGLGTTAPYNTTKYAVVGLSLSLRAAGADRGVGVHVVCPGVIDTPFLDQTDVPGLPTPPSVAGVDVRGFMRRTGMGKAYLADRLAEDVLRGIARDRAIIVTPRQARAAWLVLRLSPRLGDILGKKMTRVWREHAAAATATPASTPS
jgi:NAD(P)-dependent dehydrogenase (short-subunit alcohol dehydrogenase family)